MIDWLFVWLIDWLIDDLLFLQRQRLLRIWTRKLSQPSTPAVSTYCTPSNDSEPSPFSTWSLSTGSEEAFSKHGGKTSRERGKLLIRHRRRYHPPRTKKRGRIWRRSAGRKTGSPSTSRPVELWPWTMRRPSFSRFTLRPRGTVSWCCGASICWTGWNRRDWARDRLFGSRTRWGEF